MSGNILTGLQLSLEFFKPFLYTGVIFANFSDIGRMQISINIEALINKNGKYIP